MEVRRLLLCLAVLAAACLCAHADYLDGVNLMPDGEFQPGVSIGCPSGWTSLGDVGTLRVVRDSRHVFHDYQIADTTTPYCLAIRGEAGEPVGATDAVTLDPATRALVLTGWIQLINVMPGPDANDRPLCRIAFKMSDGTSQASPAMLAWDAATEWRMFALDIDVPVGATEIDITIAMNRCSGEADFEHLALEEVPAPTRLVMTFDDEFQGPALDTTRWTAVTGNAPWQKGNYDCSFSPLNLSFDTNGLHILADKTFSGGMPYTSGEIMSSGKFTQKYGVIETRARLPKTMGSWPAVYLIPFDDAWPPEIDVCESTGRWPTTRQINNHWKDQDGVHLQWAGTFDDPTFDRSQWHTYRVVWDANCLRFYIDGTLMRATNPTTGIADMPMYLRVNLVVGAWGGSPDTGQWPQTFDVAYVRMYQRIDRALPVTTCPSQEADLPNATVNLNAITCNPIGDGVIAWTQVSGPGKAVISDPHALATTASCPAAGMYQFRFTIIKEGASGQADVLAYINPPAPQEAQR